MSVNNFRLGCHGVSAGLRLVEGKRDEDSFLAGGNVVFTSLSQFGQQFEVLSLVNAALVKACYGPIHLVTQLFISAVPLFIAYALKCDIQNPNIKYCVIMMHNHVGDISQFTAIVSAVALVYLGSMFLAVPSLIILAIGVLDKYGILPTKIRSMFHKAMFPAVTFTSVVNGTILSRIVAFINLLLLAERLSIFNKPDAQLENNAPSEISTSVFKDILRWKASPSVNRNYINQKCFIAAPDVDISDLKILFEEIIWDEENTSTLITKIETDQRFNVEVPKKFEGNQEYINYAKSNMENFVKSIKEKKILAGEPLDYEQITQYIKHITHKLNNESDNIVKTDVLMRLAIEGGEYCGSGKFEVVEDIYSGMVLSVREIPLKTKVLQLLKNERTEQFRAVYDVVAQQGNLVYRGTVDMNDVHIYNTFQNLVGRRLGLREEGAINDHMAEAPPLLLRLIERVKFGGIPKLFWQKHNKPSIVDQVTNIMGSAQIPKFEFYGWLSEWIERQPMDQEEKGQLMDQISKPGSKTVQSREISEASLFGYPIEINNKISKRFITAMLVDYGVLTV